MKIAVIGTGNVGRALGGSFTAAGHEVTMAARDAGKVREATSGTSARAAESITDAVAGADVVVLAVPYGAVDAVERQIAPVADGKVVIDVTNPIRADFSGLATEGTSGAEQIAAALPGARVAKAFNTLFGSVQANPSTHGTTLDALFATDDDDARRVVSELASSIGFRPVYVGPLAAARELEAMAWLNIRLQVLSNGRWTSSFVLVDAPEAAVEHPTARAA